MINLLIIGAGGFGRETVEIVRRLVKEGEHINIVGFLDGNKKLHGCEINNIPVLGDIDWISNISNPGAYHFVCAIGDPYIKNKIVKRAINLHYIPYTLVDPSVIIGHGVTIGKGCIICPNNVLTCNITIKNFVILNQICSVGHDTVINDYCTINPSSAISGGVLLRENVMVGTHSAILQYLSVGRGSIIGAGACVVSNVSDYVMMLGVPAKIKKEFQNEESRREHSDFH